MNPSFPSYTAARPIEIAQKHSPFTPAKPNINDMSAAAFVLPVQDSLVENFSSSTFTRSSPISLTAATANNAQKPTLMNAGSFYLPTPPSTSPPSPRAKQLPSTVLSSFTNGSAESVMHAQIKALAEGNAIEGVDGDEGAFFVGDLGEVWKAWKSWVTELSRVELFYAVKCNPDPLVIQLLALLGTGFDCASQAEILTVLSLPSPPPPSRIIFANPCKPVSFIRSAKSLGVDAMTFDNTDELVKIAKHHPRAKLVLRILTDDSKSLCRLGLKFGAPVETCEGLLGLARELGLEVIGVSFHVGSGCKDPQMFNDAVLRAKAVFNLGLEKGYQFSLLDIGGGFEKENFGITASCLSRALDEHFPREMGVRIIGEPGRFLVSSAFTLATSVIARRAQASAVLGAHAITPESESGSEKMLGAEGDQAREREREEREMELMTSSIASLDGSLEGSGNKHVGDAGTEEGPKVMYYINDGVYGSFNCIMFDHQIVHPFPLTLSSIPRPFPPSFPPNVQLEEDLTLQMGYRATAVPASIWGPTCDSIDCVRNVVALPVELEVGDWLGWGEMGAYTICAASTFNGFRKSPVTYTTGADAEAVQAIHRLLGPGTPF